MASNKIVAANENDLYVIPPFDQSLTPQQRQESLEILCRHQADVSMQLEELENPDVPWIPQEGEIGVDYEMKRRQELERRVYQIFLDLETMAHRSQATWEIENQLEPWLDEDGNPISMLQAIEKMLPGAEERKSSGRAREKARFPEAARAFMDEGIPLETVVTCADTGKPSVLGVVASAQKKIADSVPDAEERKEKYEALIEAASEEQSISSLERRAAKIVNPLLPDPPLIPYSVEYEEDDSAMWVIMRIEDDDLRGAFFKRFASIAEQARETLFEKVIKFWKGKR